jgi:hypothetical protein
MGRVSGIAGAFVVTLALAPISAGAQQQIFACVRQQRCGQESSLKLQPAGPLRS